MTEKDQTLSPIFIKSLWVLLFVQIALICVLSLHRFFGHDEFEAMHTAWKILNGEAIYVDFFQHHHPLYYYLLAPLVAMLGESASTLVALRMTSLLAFVAMLFVSWRISLRIYNDKLAALVAVILAAGSFVFVDSAIEIRPDVPQTLLLLISFACIFAYFDGRAIKHLLLSAVCLAVSFLFLQKTVFAAAIMGCLLFSSAAQKQIPWRDTFIYAIAGILTVTPYYIYVFFSAGFDKYYTYNWLLNMKFMYTFSPSTAFATIFFTSLLLACFYVVGLVFFSRTAPQIRLAVVSVALLGSVFLIKAPFNQYFMPAMPFMAIVSANAIAQLCYRISLRSKWIVLAVFAGLVIQCWAVFNVRDAQGNMEQLALVDYVLSVTEPDDYVYDGDVTFNVFRKDLDFFWFSTRQNQKYPGALMTYQQKIADYPYDINQLIIDHKPKVIWPYGIKNMDTPYIRDNYTQSKEVDLLYLRN